MIDLVAGLDAGSWDVDLACLPGSEQWRELGGLPNVTLHPLRGWHGRPRLNDLLDLPLLMQLVARADVIHAHSSKAGFLTRLASATRHRRCHTLFTPHAWSFWGAKGVERSVYVAAERAAARWCRTIVAVSEAERDAGLAARVGRAGQYRVVVNGVDVEAFGRDPHPVGGRIVMVGRLARQKRPDVAIRAFAGVRREYPEARLDVVGDGPLRGQVEALVAELGLENSVRLLGSRDDVPELLSAATCFLLTSDYEGCPVSVVEAMAAGAPVVCTAVGGIPELVVDGETGILVEPRSPGGAARALAALLADPARARRMGLAARERARRLYSSERMVRAVEMLYQEAVSGH